MRYLSLAAAVFCAVMLFVADSATVLGLCLLGGAVFGFIAVLLFAQARIDANPQSHVAIMSPKELAEMRKRAERNRAAPSAGGQSAKAAGVDESD